MNAIPMRETKTVKGYGSLISAMNGARHANKLA